MLMVMKRLTQTPTYLALALTAALTAGFTAAGCASETSESAAMEDEAPQADTESAEAESFKESRGYRFATRRIDDVLDEIDATDVQRDKANALKDSFAEELFAMKDDGRDVRATVLEEWKKSDPDPEAMHALVDERIEIYRKMMHKAVDGAFEMHESLTDEQRAQIADMAEERMSRRWR